MENRYLCKAKRTDNGEWVEGYVSRPCSRDSLGNIESYYFNALDEMKWTFECIVSAETVCQYTGLTDKRRNRIWENDIVEILIEDGYFHLHWEEDTARFIMENYDDRRSVDFDNYWSYEVEVIGNIFDNPELLEGGEQYGSV